MGLFDVLKKIANTAVEISATAQNNTAVQSNTSTQNPAPVRNTAPVRRNAPVYETDTYLIPGAPAVDLYSFRGSPNAYFSKLLNGCFPEYEVRPNVDPSSLSGSGTNAWTCRCGSRNNTKFCAECGKSQPDGSFPITFMLYRFHMPVLSIILCDKQRANVRRTIRTCEMMRIPCQCYYTHFRNRASYVTNRIRTDLR